VQPDLLTPQAAQMDTACIYLEEFHTQPCQPQNVLCIGLTPFLWLCSGKADWAKGRYLSSNWDVNELLQMKDRIIKDDLLVNRLRAKV
jgi:hypothetical protein